MQPEPRACNAALSRAFEFLGKRWNGVILGTLQNGPVGFAALRRAIDGISDSVLSDRLAELTHAGLVTRTVDEGPPLSVSYDLATSGKALLPALEELADWAAANLSDERCATAPRQGVRSPATTAAQSEKAGSPGRARRRSST